MERLDEMRADLGEGVFDVVSTLISDTDLEKLMAAVATSPPTDDAHERALRSLRARLAEGARQQKEWRQTDFAINNDAFREMKEASRQSRLTPEYAQHFFVDALTELLERPAALPDDGPAREPGDAAVIALSLQRAGIAAELGAPLGVDRLYTFQRELAGAGESAGPGAPPRNIHYLALGTALFDRLLASVHDRWAKMLRRGARFIDPALPPGSAYLLWFLSAQVRDGRDEAVEERLFAVRQSPDGLQTVSAACLNDLVPGDDEFAIPDWVRERTADPQPVLDWSAERQQLPFLAATRRLRGQIAELRRDPLLADAGQAERAAQEQYDEAVFSDDEEASRAAGRRLGHARQRVRDLEAQFDHEAACSLGPARLLAVAVVFSPVEAPTEAMTDERPHVAAAAERFAADYERQQGREVVDVSGEHRDYPYDLHSTGPGGARCIEVKGTTSGRFMLSENEHRAARRFGASYYLYIVTDPLGRRPSLTIIRDPWAKMTHDDILYSGARYVYNATTWRAAADEESNL